MYRFPVSVTQPCNAHTLLVLPLKEVLQRCLLLVVERVAQGYAPGGATHLKASRDRDCSCPSFRQQQGHGVAAIVYREIAVAVFGAAISTTVHAHRTLVRIVGCVEQVAAFDMERSEAAADGRKVRDVHALAAHAHERCLILPIECEGPVGGDLHATDGLLLMAE